MATKKKASHQICAFHGHFLSVYKVVSPNGLPDKEVVRKKNSVGFLIYDPAQDAIILVSQPREPMITPQNPKGLTVEAPAGHLEIKDVRAEIAREASEEVGARITKHQVILLNKGFPVAMVPGWATEMMTLAYVKLRPGQLEKNERRFGLAEEGEDIKRIFIPVPRLESMIFEDLKTFALVQWFLREKQKGRL